MGIEAFRPIKLRTAADEVVAVIADAIRGGLFEPGDRLPKERDLAERLGVSRTVVREGLAVLRRAGIVSVRRGVNGGTVVESLAPLPEVLSHLHSDTYTDLRSLLEARRPLELAVALLAGERMTEPEFTALARLVDLLNDTLGDPQVFYEIDVRFHLKLGEFSGNRYLAEYVRRTLTRISTIRQQFPVGHVELSVALKNQQKTWDALRTRDPVEITDAIDGHLAAFEEHFLGHKLEFPWLAPPTS